MRWQPRRWRAVEPPLGPLKLNCSSPTLAASLGVKKQKIDRRARAARIVTHKTNRQTERPQQKAHTHAYVRCSPFWDSFGWATGTKSNGESSIDNCKKSLSPSQVLVIPVELLKKREKKERKKLARGINDYISHVRHSTV